MSETKYEVEANEPCRGHRGLARAVWGLALVVVGGALTLDNLGVLDAHQVLRWWPVLLVLFGACILLGWYEKGGRR